MSSCTGRGGGEAPIRWIFLCFLYIYDLLWFAMIYGFYPSSCMCVSYKRTYFLSHVFYAFYQTVYKIFIVVSPTPHLPNIKLFKQTYHFQTYSYQSMKRGIIKQHWMLYNYNSRLLSCFFSFFFVCGGRGVIFSIYVNLRQTSDWKRIVYLFLSRHLILRHLKSINSASYVYSMPLPRLWNRKQLVRKNHIPLQINLLSFKSVDLWVESF